MPARKTLSTNTLIIGAGAAGLAVAACLRRHRVPLVLLERKKSVGSAWLHRYDRLHLHTHRRFSSLPFLSFPRGYPVYPSSRQVADYLALYADAFDLSPVFGAEVLSAARDGGLWTTKTTDRTYVSRNLVVATGHSNVPVTPEWPGMDTFAGASMHSASYTNGAGFKGRKVLVVGFGNSAGEIAIDLHEHGASVAMSVRSPVNVVPRDLFGLSTHAISVMLSRLPTEVADALSGTLRRAVVGNLKPYGLQPESMGPMTQIKRTGRTPLLDIGTIGLIKGGKIRVLKDVARVDAGDIVFVDDTKERFDAVVFATGFRTGIEAFLDESDQALDEHGHVPASGRESRPGALYFCGFRNAPAGILREIGIEARRIAKAISKKNTTIPELVAKEAA